MSIYSLLKLPNTNTIGFVRIEPASCKFENRIILLNVKSPHPDKFKGEDDKLPLHMLWHMAAFQNHSD